MKKKEDALNRLRRIEGHLRGVARMVEQDGYCIEILQQVLATQRAVDKLNRQLRHTHLEACVTKALSEKNDKKRQRVIRELLDIFSALIRD